MKMKYLGLGPLRLGVNGESKVVRHNDVVDFADDDSYPTNLFEKVEEKTSTKKQSKTVVENYMESEK
jgi:hypothetical protein